MEIGQYQQRGVLVLKTVTTTLESFYSLALASLSNFL